MLRCLYMIGTLINEELKIIKDEIKNKKTILICTYVINR